MPVPPVLFAGEGGGEDNHLFAWVSDVYRWRVMTQDKLHPEAHSFVIEMMTFWVFEQMRLRSNLGIFNALFSLDFWGLWNEISLFSM